MSLSGAGGSAKCLAKLTAGLNFPPLMSAKIATLMARDMPKENEM